MVSISSYYLCFLQSVLLNISKRYLMSFFLKIVDFLHNLKENKQATCSRFIQIEMLLLKI